MEALLDAGLLGPGEGEGRLWKTRNLRLGFMCSGLVQDKRQVTEVVGRSGELGVYPRCGAVLVCVLRLWLTSHVRFNHSV